MADHRVTDKGTVIATYKPGGKLPPYPPEGPIPATSEREMERQKKIAAGALAGAHPHGHPSSSYTWKALIALYANGTAFTFRDIDTSVPKFESFTGKAHPSGQFPMRTDDQAVVVEAGAILEHLAVHHPGPGPLIPRIRRRQRSRGCATGCPITT